MVKKLIFDLDQTLVDSSIAEPYRDSRQWSMVYTTIPKFKIYTGLNNLFDYINHNNYKVCIVTTSPGSYCERVLRHWKIPYHYMVCFHDVKKRKPDPEAFFIALDHLKAKPEDVLSFGDRVTDIQASLAAQIPSVACLWGSSESSLLISAKPTYIVKTPDEALQLIKTFR